MSATLFTLAFLAISSVCAGSLGTLGSGHMRRALKAEDEHDGDQQFSFVQYLGDEDPTEHLLELYRASPEFLERKDIVTWVVHEFRYGEGSSNCLFSVACCAAALCFLKRHPLTLHVATPIHAYDDTASDRHDVVWRFISPVLMNRMLAQGTMGYYGTKSTSKEQGNQFCTT